MLKLSVNELTTFRWTLEEDLAHFATAGVSGIGVWRQKLSDCGEYEGIDLINDSQLEVSSLLWAGGFTGSDGSTHRDGITDAIEALHIAASVGAHCLVVYTGGRGGHTRSHSRRLVMTALRELVEIAEDLEVTIALEPMHVGCGADWTFLHTLDETVNWLNEIDSPYLKMVFDTYHMGYEYAINERVADVVDKIALVHLGDAMCPPLGEQNRCGIGAGDLPLTEMIHSLQEAGYDGFYEIELLGEDVESRDYGQLIEESVQALHDIAGVVR